MTVVPGSSRLMRVAKWSVLAGVTATVSGAGSVDVGTFLAGPPGFSKAEIARVQRGEVVARNLSADDHTVAIAAAAVIAVPPDFFLARVKDIEQFKKSPEVLQIGRVGTPPSVQDFARLSLEAAELDAVRKCRPGACELKLDAGAIETLRALPANADVMRGLREHLATYIAQYLREGNDALVTYNDRAKPLPLRAEFERIVDASPAIAQQWPVLHGALAQFSGKLPDSLEGFVYWSKEKVASR